MSEPTVLCIDCRATFTDEQTVGATACPSCGSRSVPADLRKQGTLTLTHHEWRILFMWADRWAETCGMKAPATVAALRREAHRQMPGIEGGLSLGEDIQEAVNNLGTKAELVSGGERTTFEPEKKH